MTDTGQKRHSWKLVFLGLNIVIFLAIVALVGSTQGATITVDDDGGADYETIQDAVDNSAEGDLIRVYDGTYKENVMMEMKMDVVGNGSATTFVDAGGNGDGIMVTADWTNLSGFSITGAIEGRRGVVVLSSHNNISHNTIHSNYGGVGLMQGTHNNTLWNNVIRDNEEVGIRFVGSSYNLVTGNHLTGNDLGLSAMAFEGEVSKGNELHQNEIAGNSDYGIDASNNDYHQVNATDNWWGDVSGPYHKNKNWQATGDNVTDYVDFDPWYKGPKAEILKIDPNPAEEDEEISFTGSSDSWADAVLYAWSSHLDGELYNDTKDSFSTDTLSAEDHEISLRVKDEFGLWSEEAEEELSVKKVTTYLSGYAWDEESEGAVEGAEVKLNGFETITDLEGCYYLECEVGEFELVVKHDDYEEYKTDISIEKGENSHNIPMKKLVTYLEGYVKDQESQEPVEGVVVRLNGNETTTNETGYYYLKCEEGDYTVLIHLDHINELSDELHFKKGNNRCDWQLTIETYLDGFVKDQESQEPVVDAKIKLNGYETTTNDTGYFYLECEEDEYTLEIDRRHYHDYLLELTVEKGGNVNNAYLVPATYLEGFVKDHESGEAVNRALVGLGDHLLTTTNDTGYYYLKCEEGDYALTVYMDPVNIFSTEITIMSGANILDHDLVIITYLEGFVKDQESQEPLVGAVVFLDGFPTFTNDTGYYYLRCEEGDYDLTVGMDLVNMLSTEITIMRGANILDHDLVIITYLEGFVRDQESQEPVAGAVVSLKDNETTTNETGYYYLECEEGDYDLTVCMDPVNMFSTELNILSGANVLDHDLAIITYLEGFVKDQESQEPLVGAVVRLEDNETTTNETGYYYLVCEEGDYTLTAYMDPVVAFMDPVDAYMDPVNAFSRELTILSGANILDHDLVIITYLGGCVWDQESQKAVEGVVVKLWMEDNETTTNETGYFYLECEVGEGNEGQYLLLFEHDYYEKREFIFFAQKEGSMFFIFLERSVAYLDVVKVEGHVTDEETGDPVAGAKVKLDSHETITDENGHYYLEYEEEGEFELEVKHDDWEEEYKAKISLERGENTHNVTLWKIFTYLEGYVTLDGDPAEGAEVTLRGVATTTTDENGYYYLQFDGLDEGSYTLYVLVDGRDRKFEKENSKDLVKGRNEHNFQLTKKEDSTPGFELVALVPVLAAALVLHRRKRKD